MDVSPRYPFVFAATLALTMAIPLVAPPQPALAAPVLDQQQSTIDTTVGGLAIGATSLQKLGQGVTAGATGDLVQIDLPVACSGTADLIIEVTDVTTSGAPGSTVSSSTTIPGSTLPSFGSGTVTFRPLVLATSVPVTSGSGFAFVLRSNGATANDNCGVFRGPLGDSYTGGDLYFDALPNPSGWVRTCSFANERCDLPFRTWVEPPGPRANLAITKTLVNPNNLNVFAATDQLYQLTVTNIGPDTATGVTIRDTLPQGVTYRGGAPCTISGSTLSCTAVPGTGILPAGQSSTIFVPVSFDRAGSYLNTAIVGAQEVDLNTSNNTSSHTQQVLPTADLLVASVSAVPGVAAPGDTVTYDAVVQNLGPDPTGDVVLVQTIPAGSTFVSISSPQNICGQSGTNPGEYGCRFGTMAVGASRSMTVTVTAPSSQQALETTLTASHVVPPLILDPPQGAPSVMSFRSWVISESVQQSVSAGGTATTDTEADGATTNDPIETTVQAPAAGTVTITERKATSSASPGWTAFGTEVVISAPAGTTSNPIRLTFRFDAAILGQFTDATVEVFRNNASSAVAECQQPIYPGLPSATTPISPDPCVWRRATLSDGDVEIVIFTSQASVWGFAVHEPFAFGGFQAPVRAGTTVANAGRAVPLKFSLGGYQGMVILGGSPLSRPVSCETGAPAGTLAAIDLVGGGLRYDAATDTYSLNWNTDRQWAGTCRQLVLRLIDGTEHAAAFAFK